MERRAVFRDWLKNVFVGQAVISLGVATLWQQILAPCLVVPIGSTHITCEFFFEKPNNSNWCWKSLIRLLPLQGHFHSSFGLLVLLAFHHSLPLFAKTQRSREKGTGHYFSWDSLDFYFGTGGHKRYQAHLAGWVTSLLRYNTQLLVFWSIPYNFHLQHIVSNRFFSRLCDCCRCLWICIYSGRRLRWWLVWE